MLVSEKKKRRLKTERDPEMDRRPQTETEGERPKDTETEAEIYMWGEGPMKHQFNS